MPTRPFWLIRRTLSVGDSTQPEVLPVAACCREVNRFPNVTFLLVAEEAGESTVVIRSSEVGVVSSVSSVIFLFN